jgi:hypothetical protein
LTLDGHSPTKTSSKNLEEDKNYFCISYRDHILRWFELCRKETVNSPFLRETINQYILLVKQLTGQARSKQMSNEIVNVITKSEENFKAYWDIVGLNRQEIITHVFEDKVLPSVKKVAKEHGLEFLDCSDFNILEEKYGFIFKKPEWKEIEINFYFFKNLTNLVYYIHDMEKNFGEVWKSRKKMEKYRDWNNRDVIEKLFYPDNDVIREVENKLIELIPAVEALIKQR